jgi:hypothetical protein
MLEAFFGLDDELPLEALGLCASAPGADGMPVIFTHRLGQTELDPTAFQVATAGGVLHTPACATTRPAAEASENHTVLLIGDLGGIADPPVRVTVMKPLPLVGASPSSAVGLTALVTPLDDGPRLELAFPLSREEGLECPDDTVQGFVVVWSGGIVPADGRTDEDHRRAYTVDVDGVTVTPVALGDLGDNDNYVHLCLAEAGVPRVVRVGAGVVVDPRGDANDGSQVDIATR